MIELTHLHPHGVFLRREALRLGYDDDQLRNAVRSGVLARVRHGAYTSAATWAAADPIGRHVLRCHAVLATHDEGVALTHTSAAAFHGLAIWPETGLERVHLTRLDGRTTRVCNDVAYHRGRIPDEHLVPIGPGLVASSAARAAVEHASLTSVEGGVVTLDSHLHLHGREAREDVQRVYAARPNWPGNRGLRIALSLARPGAESVGESRMRYLFFEYHLPEPELQVPVLDHGGQLLGFTDFGWTAAGLLGEFDGRVKYEKFLRPGESSSDAVVREKRREDLMREHSNCTMIRFVWSDLRTRDKTAARIRRALRLA